MAKLCFLAAALLSLVPFSQTGAVIKQCSQEGMGRHWLEFSLHQNNTVECTGVDYGLQVEWRINRTTVVQCPASAPCSVCPGRYNDYFSAARSQTFNSLTVRNGYQERLNGSTLGCVTASRGEYSCMVLVVQINRCVSNPCQNGGTCSDQSGYYTCACPTGYEGRNCESAATKCWSNPCRNGATCKDEVGYYTCECPDGFLGRHCETYNEQDNMSVMRIEAATPADQELETGFFYSIVVTGLVFMLAGLTVLTWGYARWRARSARSAVRASSVGSAVHFTAVDRSANAQCSDYDDFSGHL